MRSDVEAYHELSAYTLTHRGPAFIHQHVVDAWAVQHPREGKPIGVFFALVGLYLHVERGFTGREVQRAHMQLGKRRDTWPAVPKPSTPATMTAADVVAAPAGAERDAMIHAWAKSVWNANAGSREMVMEALRRHGIL